MFHLPPVEGQTKQQRSLRTCFSKIWGRKIVYKEIFSPQLWYHVEEIFATLVCHLEQICRTPVHFCTISHCIVCQTPYQIYHHSNTTSLFVTKGPLLHRIGTILNTYRIVPCFLPTFQSSFLSNKFVTWHRQFY